MSSRIWIGVCAVALVGAFLFGGAFAQGMPMPEWMKATQQHVDLKKYAGDWNLAMSMWMAPGMPAQKYTATSTCRSILNGMYLEETVKGTFDGMPFEGRSTMGYDTVRKKWVSTWMDNMTPVMGVYYGTEKDGVITSYGEDPDMMTGRLKKTKITLTRGGDDGYTMAMYDIAADGSERKTMEIVYTRRGDGCGCDDGCGCGD